MFIYHSYASITIKSTMQSRYVFTYRKIINIAKPLMKDTLYCHHNTYRHKAQPNWPSCVLLHLLSWFGIYISSIYVHIDILLGKCKWPSVNTCIKYAQMVNFRLNVLLINHNQMDLYIHSKHGVLLSTIIHITICQIWSDHEIILNCIKLSEKSKMLLYS